ncbi:protein kinase C-binding protein NELL2-like [Mytilus edulis]|uniref:protein kinase C-binding protein NELL2-like n=1 Tax=Mytilus edulis TaxID=6550 RepID=UPI0039F0AA84
MCGCQGGQMRKLDGTCTDMSLCILSDYCVHGTCLNTTLIPTCVCESGYTGLRCDTKTVHIVKYCNGKLCNHGVCVGTFCLCDMGWEGELCDTLQQCQNGYSTISHCFPYDTDVTFDLCPIDTIRNCHTCYLYPFTKSGVICDINIEGENVRLKLIDGSFVERINKDHGT